MKITVNKDISLLPVPLSYELTKIILMYHAIA
jgi:hypothetical protein